MTAIELIEKIIKINIELRDFWTNAEGWAPSRAANILSQSRLDWQVSLSHCLKIWTGNWPQEECHGRLILAWTNLGSLMEGSMQLLLSVYYEDYLKDDERIMRKDKLIEPNQLGIEEMRHFFIKKVFLAKDMHWGDWIRHIQNKRNAIHAFRDRDIGSKQEFYKDLEKYLCFLNFIDNRLPYPEDIFF